VGIIREQCALVLAIGVMMASPAAVLAQQAQEPGGEAEQLQTAEDVEAEKAEAAKEEKESWLPAGLSGNVAVYTDYSSGHFPDRS
jgi:hypothetical protein